MSHATFTFGRFNPPTEEGHGKLVKAVQSHAEEHDGKHYIFPSHSQDAKKNPMSHGDKVSSMKKLFPGANVVSHKHVRTAIDALKHLEKQGHTHATMIVGSDRVPEFHKMLNKYNGKEYNFKKIDVKSAGHRDPDAEGAEGMSASKLRGLVKSGKKDEFVSHYSDPKVGKAIHDKVKKGMQLESNIPVGVFLLGGPGSGKDYVLNNIFSRFGLIEVQIDQILSGKIEHLIEGKRNLVINGSADTAEKIEKAKSMLEGYAFDQVLVSVTNKVSRERNSARGRPLREDIRIHKWLKAEELADCVEDVFVFNNTINLTESTEIERLLFANQIERLLARLVENGLNIIQETPVKVKSFKSTVKTFNSFSKLKQFDDPPPVKEDINAAFESFEIGTAEYLKHAVETTPGQGSVEDAKKNMVSDKYSCFCGEGESGECGCAGTCPCGGKNCKGKEKTNEAKVIGPNAPTVNVTPILQKKPPKKGNLKAGINAYDSQVGGGGGSNVFGGLMPQVAVESRLKSFRDFKNK